MEHWAPGMGRAIDASGGLELFVINGAVSDGIDSFGPWDWLRLPLGSNWCSLTRIVAPSRAAGMCEDVGGFRT